MKSIKTKRQSRLRCIIGALLAIGCIGIATAQQGRPGPDKKVQELLDLKAEQLRLTLDSLEKTEKEDDLQLLTRYYSATDATENGERLTALILQKYPDGLTAFKNAADDLYEEANPEEKIKKYHAFMNRFRGKPEFAENNFFQSANTFVAFSLAKDNPNEVQIWLDKITDGAYRTKAYSYAARELAKEGNYKHAEKLIRISMEETRESQPLDTAFYLETVRLAAGIFVGAEKYDEAYPYARMAYDEVRKEDSKIHKAWREPIDVTYLNALVGTERYKEAFPMMEESVKKGIASTLIKDRFEKAYLLTHDGNINYESYFEQLLSKVQQEVKSETRNEMINVPAYNFMLTNAKGKAVSLEDFKGKVVILDFWATWCAPCKASFPRMQMAVDKYRDDPEVSFLFIHTWESSSDPQVAINHAVGYLKENNYTFDLLMDLKEDGVARSNKAAKGFGIKGIPTKLIIDKNGQLRFNIIGDTKGGDDAFMMHMDAMIELAKEVS